jgi:hypothetical protein
MEKESAKKVELESEIKELEEKLRKKKLALAKTNKVIEETQGKLAEIDENFGEEKKKLE